MDGYQGVMMTAQRINVRDGDGHCPISGKIAKVFFSSYQLNFMYWRYFMWNFAGQNDIQEWRDFEHGNWITGFKFIDNLFVGNQDLMPQDLKNNKGHNVFYCLPLLLGIIGFVAGVSPEKRSAILGLYFSYSLWQDWYCSLPEPNA